MASVDCRTCAERYEQHRLGLLLAVFVSPVRLGCTVVAALGRLVQDRRHQPRLCLLAGNQPLRRDLTRAIRRVFDELGRSCSARTRVELVVVQDRVTRPDGEPLRVAVQRAKRDGPPTVTIRLALHTRTTCYGPAAVAATLADTLAALYEREAQLVSVLEVPARVAREAPKSLAAAAPTWRNGASPNGTSRNGLGKPYGRNGVLTPLRTMAKATADESTPGFPPKAPGGRQPTTTTDEP